MHRSGSVDRHTDGGMLDMDNLFITNAWENDPRDKTRTDIYIYIYIYI